MPILVLTAEQQALPTEPTYVRPPDKAKPARDVIMWTRSDGKQRILTDDDGATLRPGLLGLDMPPLSEWAAEPPGIDGSLYQGYRLRPKALMIPVRIRAETLDEITALRRDVMDDFDPEYGTGTLVFAYPDGSQRELAARYAGGLESIDGGYDGATYFEVYAVDLTADDPYWYGAQVKPRRFQQAVGGSWYPMPPVDFAPSDPLGITSEMNEGRAEAWPVWTVEGPAVTVTLRNLTTGEELVLAPNLLGGETVTVTTDPRTPAVRKIVDGVGVSMWSAVTSTDPHLWPLVRGVNEIQVEAAGAGPATAVELTYRPRFKVR